MFVLRNPQASAASPLMQHPLPWKRPEIKRLLKWPFYPPPKWESWSKWAPQAGQYPPSTEQCKSNVSLSVLSTLPRSEKHGLSEPHKQDNIFLSTLPHSEKHGLSDPHKEDNISQSTGRRKFSVFRIFYMEKWLGVFMGQAEANPSQTQPNLKQAGPS